MANHAVERMAASARAQAVRELQLGQPSLTFSSGAVTQHTPMGEIMKPTRNVDEYIASFPRAVQEILKKIRATVKAAAPDAKETLKYRMPTFVLGENLVHFAAFEKHIGSYPTPSAIEAFRRELAGYDSGKGSVQFPLEREIPFALIEKMVRFRVKEALRRKRPERRRKR